MAQPAGSLTDTLIAALSQGQAVAKQVEDQQKHIEKLFGELAAKQAEIDALKKELRMVQAKERKWRLQTPQISSPVVLSDEVEHTSRPTTPPSSDGRHSSPVSHVQVESPPPKKRPRTTQERTPLGEVQSTTRQPLSRTEKAIAAIPSLAEDGEETARKLSVPKPPKECAEAKNGAHNRLGGLLTGPAPLKDVLQTRTTPVSPRPQSAVPTLRKSSSDLDQREAATRRKARFLKPKQHPHTVKSLRGRPVTELSITDFKLNLEYVEEYDRPQGQQRRGLAVHLGDELSDNELLREVLGKDADEKIGKLTAVARDNLLSEARARKVAEGFAQSKQQESENRGPLQTNYWNTDFPSSMDEKGSRVDVAAKVREEVSRRYKAAIEGHGRWRFKDE